MGKQLMKDASVVELMGENIIGIYLSREPLCESHPTVEDDEPKLQRFVNSQENIEQPRLIGSGEHGVFTMFNWPYNPEAMVARTCGNQHVSKATTVQAVLLPSSLLSREL